MVAVIDTGVAHVRGLSTSADQVIDDTTPLGAAAERVKTHTAFSFATQVCILDAEGRVERFIAAHDVGRAINRQQVEGQIEGCLAQAIGYALDYDGIIEFTVGGAGAKTPAPIPNGFPGTAGLPEPAVARLYEACRAALADAAVQQRTSEYFRVLAGLCADLGNSPADKQELRRRAEEVSHILAAAGVKADLGDLNAETAP